MTVPGLLASRPGYHESRAHKAALACCRSTRRRGQDRGGFAFLAASPHGAHTLRSHQGLGFQAEAVRPHTPRPGPRRHSPDRKWSEARDWARSALFQNLSSFLGALPGQVRPGALLRPLTASEGLMPSDKPRRSAALRQRGRAWPWPSPRRTAVRSQWTPRPAPGTSEETQEGGKPHSSNQQAIFSSGQS